MNGDELLGAFESEPHRYSIDFSFSKNISEVAKVPDLFKLLESKVLPEIKRKAEAEITGGTKANGREDHLETWWKFWRRREDMLQIIAPLKRFIACSRVTSRSIFEFVPQAVRPNDALMVFAFEDDYSFGVIQSDAHWQWWKAKCSTFEARLRYTTTSVWDTFPWPQRLSKKQQETVAQSAKNLRDARTQAMQDHRMSLRDLYRLLEKPGKNPIKDLHASLDKAVLAAYGFDAKQDLLAQLLALNREVAEKEGRSKKVRGPGL